MYKRAMETELKSLALQYPIVTISGPRQSGKTTLTRAVFPNKPYVNLEAPDIRLFASEDPRSFLNQYPDGAILDEIQRVPHLLSYIQVIVDERNIKGMYVLTGSHQIELHQAITQSLAGRTALLFLLPLSLSELKEANINQSLDEYLLTGFFPRIYQDQLNPTKAYRNYLQTYIERDLRELIQVKDLKQFQRFIKLCAGRIGQVVHYEGLSNDIGVSSQTIKHWLSVLEASYIIILLQPYFENFGKRIIKSPKLYFTDVGLASYILEIENISQISRDPIRGHLFENLVILELMKTRLNIGLDPHLYYYRDSHQNEVDVIYTSGHKLIPIEIKSSQTYNSSFSKNLNFFRKLVPDKVDLGYIVYSGSEEQKILGNQLINYNHTSQIITN